MSTMAGREAAQWAASTGTRSGPHRTSASVINTSSPVAASTPEVIAAFFPTPDDDNNCSCGQLRIKP
jgi:hypothetical protein